jgi:hypothetical protein
MCTVVILRRPDHSWPILIAANRDEMIGRPWLPPGRHWNDRPNVRAGRDIEAGGSWLGLNDEGVVAAVLNRQGSLGPLAGKRSRGELVLEALDHSDAVAAAQSLRYLAPDAYRPFNMLLADNRDAFWLRSDGHDIRALPIGEGLSILTAFDLNAQEDPRIAAFLPAFRNSHVPDPDKGHWQSWKTLLATHAPGGGFDRESGLTFQLDNGFGTRSSALLALPSVDRPEVEPIFLFAPGPPDQTHFCSVPA